MFNFSGKIPLIGAQVFIEPGQTPEEIDQWFKILNQNGMTICRIRMFETYMHMPDDSWDFTLFDNAFLSAEKYGINVLATIFPFTPFMDIGGFKFPRDTKHLNSIANCIRHIVSHFKQFSALVGWVLINEPGVEGVLPNTPFTAEEFKEWLKDYQEYAFNTAGFPIVNFEEENFLLAYNSWFLNWIVDEIRRYDYNRHVHVNNHQIFKNVAEYDFPSWRKFLNSFGGSAHASWHFGYFKRQQYAIAMSANSEIIRSGAGEIPWFMTELQGGNNTYSGFNALCPTAYEISQWLWIIIGSGAKGAIFWTLNSRASGLEAGEWSLLTLQNEPSDRLTAASEVAAVLNNNPELFADVVIPDPTVYVLYTRESLWIEKKSQTGGTAYEGREIGGVMKSALAFFEALSEMGLQPSFQEIREFDFSKDDYSGTAIILAHQIAIPSSQISFLEHFVNSGGKLIVEGLTAYFDEQMHHIMRGNFPLEKLFGGNMSEIKLIDELFDINITQASIHLKGHLWQGTLKINTAQAIAMKDNNTIASRNKFGKGEVLWIPSLVGLGARLTDYNALQQLLAVELKFIIENVPFKLKKPSPGILIKVLKNSDYYILIIVNKNKNDVNLSFYDFDKDFNRELYRNSSKEVKCLSDVCVVSEETVVLLCN